MAFKPVVLLLWELPLFFHCVTSLCDVTCSTDYEVSLNCSCSGAVPTRPVLIKVMCSGERLDVNGSCEVKPPLSWCVMYPDNLEEVAYVETTCNATVDDHDGAKASESPRWALSNVVKPPPPSHVQVTNVDGYYNVTWDHVNSDDCLTYRVRVRERKDLSKNPAHSLSVKEKYALLDHKKLQPHVVYTVDLQAQMCPENLYIGPWSEWSSAADWRTTGTCEDTKALWWCVPVIAVLLLLLFGFLKKTWWMNKFRQIIYIPRADEFFKPLDLDYGGNFKEWVKPVFSEYDYLRINLHSPMTSDKHHSNVLQLNDERQSYGEDNETKQGGRFLHMLQDGGSSQGAGRSTGRVSIHTVTLSGEEELEEEVASQSSVNTLKSYQDGKSFGSFEEDNRERAGYDLEEPCRRSGILPERENQISNNLSAENVNFEPRAGDGEPERASLDSFASNEQSEDGYPHVDLDTIDSGFGECGSPGALDSNMTEQMDSDLFHEHKGSNSNYVKQWMICRTIPEDSGSSEKEVHETP